MHRTSIMTAILCALSSAAPRAAGAKTVFWTDTNNRTVNRAEVDGTGTRVLAELPDVPTAIATDIPNQRLFWSRFGGAEPAAVQFADLDGGCIGNLLTVPLGEGNAHGVAVLGSYIYWGKYSGGVWQSHITGTQVKELVGPGQGAALGDIEVDVATSKLYWTNYLPQATAIIQRANVDGTDVEDVVPTATGAAGLGLAIDPLAGKIYWVEDDMQRIRRADLDGGNVELVLSWPGVIDVAIDAASGRIYWSDGDLWRADLGTLLPELVLSDGGVEWIALWPGEQRASAAVPMNKFLALPTDYAGAGPQGVRVKMTTMYNVDPDHPDAVPCPPRTADLNDLTVFEGEYRWVGPPNEFPDATVPTPTTLNFVAGKLQCCPHYADWRSSALTAAFAGETGVTGDPDATYLYLYGAEVLPCSAYEVQFIDGGCPIDDEECYSEPIKLRTTRWGNVVRPFYGAGSPQPNFWDIVGVVNRYRYSASSCTVPSKVQCLLRANSAPPDTQMNFVDIGHVVQGYKRIPYKQPGPTPCGPCE